MSMDFGPSPVDFGQCGSKDTTFAKVLRGVPNNAAPEVLCAPVGADWCATSPPSAAATLRASRDGGARRTGTTRRRHPSGGLALRPSGPGPACGRPGGRAPRVQATTTSPDATTLGECWPIPQCGRARSKSYARIPAKPGGYRSKHVPTSTEVG